MSPKRTVLKSRLIHERHVTLCVLGAVAEVYTVSGSSVILAVKIFSCISNCGLDLPPTN